MITPDSVENDSAENDGRDLSSRSGPQSSLDAGAASADSACPPECADVPVRELFDHIDAERKLRAAAAAAAGEPLAAGFMSRAVAGPPSCGSGFESGAVLDTSAPSGSLAGLT